MVQCSFRLPNADYLGFPATAEAILQTALKAEEAGFDAVFVNDHVIVDDSARSEPWRQVYDPLMSLAYVGITHLPDRAGHLGSDHALPQSGGDRQDDCHAGPDVQRTGHRRRRVGLERDRICRAGRPPQ